MEPTGIEPVTSCLQGRCSTKIELRPHIFVFVCPKRQASFPLCQLHLIGTGIATYQISCVATPTGLEPATSRVTVWYSTLLNYGAIFKILKTRRGLCFTTTLTRRRHFTGECTSTCVGCPYALHK